MTWPRAVGFWVMILATACGCKPTFPSPGGAPPAENSGTAAARRHNDEAARLLEGGDLKGAEREFQAAVAADKTFGPARNNLGLVY